MLSWSLRRFVERKDMTMKAFLPNLVAMPSVQWADVPDAVAAPHEAVIAVEAYSINRGETFLLERPASGWRPGKDVAGVVAQAAADGSGPAAGTRVVAHPPSAGWAERVAVATSQMVSTPWSRRHCRSPG
jgi:NADPH:quinone reductase